MVKIALQIKAQLENLTDLETDGEDFRWYLKLKCSSCSEVTTDFVHISLLENQPLKGGRGHASIVIKCKLCSRENSADIIKESLKRYTCGDPPKFQSIVSFDCRGIEPVDFSPRVGWKAKGANSETVFEEIDLKEGEWADYDEKAGESVGIYELEHQFVKDKNVK